jgi:hypothetical protein
MKAMLEEQRWRNADILAMDLFLKWATFGFFFDSLNGIDV